MKKNFFKKLATVLSLAMVVTSVAPLAGTTASAAATPDIKNRRTTAYEGNSYSYAVKNAKGYTVKWSVSGKLATISKTGKLTVKTKGAKAGNIVVSAAFYKNGKKVVTRKDTVAVKVSAKSVAITTKADVNAIPAGEVADFNRTLTPANSTSKTYWTVTGKDGAATTTATIDSVGKLTATAVGEYVVTATVRNAKTSKVLATATQAVTVVNAVKEVKQTAVKKINVTLSADASKELTKDNLTIVNDKKVKQVVKSVSFDATGKVATVETYLEFANDVTYTVTYGKSSLDFVAKKGDVATVQVKSKEVQYNTKTNLDVTLFDANGIDVTTDELLAKVDVTTDKGWVDDNKTKQPKITLFNVGDVATVSATFKSGTYKDGKEITSETAKATITAVKELKATGSLVAATIALASDGPNWDKTVSTIGAESTGFKVFAKMKDSDGTIYDSAVYGNKFSFESTDSNVLIVNKDGSISPVKEGTAYVKVTYGASVEMVAITVGAKAKAATITVDKGALTLSNLFTNTQTVEIKVKDQYGNDFTSATIQDVTVKHSDNAAVAPTNTVNGLKVTFSAGTGTTAKDGYQVTIKSADLFVPVSIDVKHSTNVGNKTNTPVRLELGSRELDTKYSTSLSNLTIEPYEYTTDGVKYNTLGTIYDGGVDVTNNGAYKVVVTDPDGKNIATHADYASTYANIITGTVAAGNLKFNASWDNAGVINKVKTGTWKVEVQVYRTSSWVAVAAESFVVKDTQALPTIKTNGVVYDASYTAIVYNNASGSAIITGSAIAAAQKPIVLNVIQATNDPLFTAKFADEASDVVAGSARLSDVEFSAADTAFADASKEYQVYIKSITVLKSINGKDVPCKVNIGQYITIK